MRDDIRARREAAALERIKNALGQDIELPPHANRATSDERKVYLLEAIADAIEGVNVSGGENLEDKTVAELREIASERGMEGYSEMKKAELIKALK